MVEVQLCIEVFFFVFLHVEGVSFFLLVFAYGRNLSTLFYYTSLYQKKKKLSQDTIVTVLVQSSLEFSVLSPNTLFQYS